MWHQPQQVAWGPQDPGNGTAVTAFVLSLCGLGLLFVSAGLSSIVSLGMAISGIVLGRKGRQRVERGLTRQNKDLATAALVIGIIGTVFSVLATILWAAFIGFAVVEDSSGSDDPFNGDGDPAVITARAAVTGARLVGALLS